MAARYWVGGTDTWDATAGTKWALTSGGAGGQAVPTSADTVFFNAASGANTITLGSGYNPTISTLTMTGFTGTLDFGSQNISVGGTGTVYTGATTFSVAGTPVINCTNSSATARTITPAAVTEANSISFNITAGTGSFAISTSGAVRNLNFTGFTGSLNSLFRTIYGSMTLGAGMTATDGTGTWTFASTTQQQNITSNGVTFGGPITVNGTQTFQLQDALTLNATRSLVLTNGILDLNNKTLTVGVFSSSNANARSILFGTGNITLIGSGATIWATSSATNLTVTGTPTVNATYSGSTGTRTITPNQTTTNNLFNFNITAGTDTLAISSSRNVNNLNFTGFSGILSNFATTNLTIYGDVTFSSAMTFATWSTGNLVFSNSSVTQKLTSNGCVIELLSNINNGSTVQLQDNVKLGTTQTFTLTQGTLDLNSKKLTCGIFSSSNSNTRTINFNNGTIENSVYGHAWNTATSTNLTLSGSGTISMTSASAKTFAGGSKVYSTLNQGGTGNLIITGTNTFSNITNTAQPATITFPASTITTVLNMALAGIAGSLITINSSTAGTQATLYNPNSTTISVNYCSIIDNNATGGARWSAYSSYGNIDAGDNDGWVWTAPLESSTLTYADFVRVTIPSTTGGPTTYYRFASTPSALTIPEVDSQPFDALGTLIKVGDAQRDIKSTANETSFTLVGIDTAVLGWVLSNQIKGAQIEAWHGFFDENGALITDIGTGGLYQFFNGYINSFAIQEQWMEEIRQFVGVITVNASSIQIILKNRIAGRYTNDNSWQFYNIDDTSMDRVAFVSTISYYFGKGAKPNS